MIRYTCIYCGKTVDLPDDRQNSVFTCPACRFSNWVSGVMAQQLDEHQVRQGQGPKIAPPQTRQVEPQTQSPRPSATQRSPAPLNRPGPKPSAPAGNPAAKPAGTATDSAHKQPAGAISHEHISQWLKAPPKNPPPLPPQAGGQAQPKVRPQASRPITNNDQNLELLQNDIRSKDKSEYYRPRQTNSPDEGVTVCPQAIASIAVGMLGLLSLGCANRMSVVPGIIAIVLGLMAKSKISNAPKELGGVGLAIGGIIMGMTSLVIAFVR